MDGLGEPHDVTVFNFGIQQSKPTGGGSYDAAALALFARMSPTPSTARKTTINNLIVALKGYGIWTKLDVLYLLAADVQLNSLLNWISTSNNATAVSSPSFTADQGFTGDGAAAYLNTGYVGGTGQFALADHCAGAWARTNGGGGITMLGYLDGSAGGVGLYMQGTNGIADGQSPRSQATSTGHQVISRTVSTAFDYYSAGSLVANFVNGFPNFTNAVPFYVLAYDFWDPFAGTNVPAGFTIRQVSAFHAGAGLTATEVGNLNTALTAYMTDVGAYP